jgi:hypothetical protein
MKQTNTKFLIIIAIFTLLSCQQNQEKPLINSNKKNSNIEKSKKPEIRLTDTLNNIENEEIKLNEITGLSLGAYTLIDFELNGADRSEKENDTLFIAFLKSFTDYQNKSNELLFDHPKYEIYNTLAYAPNDSIYPEAIKFQDSIQQIGFIVATSEGSIYLEKNADFLNKFSPYLSKRMNLFLSKYNVENNEPIAEDGALIITMREHIKRMLFWEKFKNNNPDFELPEYAENQFEMYLFYLMFGMDNTPIYNWNDSFKIRTELIDTFNTISTDYPDTRATKMINEYLKYLEEKDFKYDTSFNVYAKEKFPNMFGA